MIFWSLHLMPCFSFYFQSLINLFKKTQYFSSSAVTLFTILLSNGRPFPRPLSFSMTKSSLSKGQLKYHFYLYLMALLCLFRSLTFLRNSVLLFRDLPGHLTECFAYNKCLLIICWCRKEAISKSNFHLVLRTSF